MTVSSTQSRKDYAGDGATTQFTVPYFFIENADIVATLRSTGSTETTWTEGTEYTLTGAGNPSGGTLTAVSTGTDYTPQSGETLVIRRLEQYTQPSDFAVAGSLPSETIEEGYDRLTMLAQQLREEQGRMMVAPVGESGIDLTLPSSETRASKFLAFNSAAKPFASAGAAGSSDVPVSAFGKTLIDDVSSTEARTTLELVIGTDVQAFDVDTAKLDVAQTWTAVQTLGATLAAADQQIERPELKDYAETVNAIGATGGGAQDIDVSLGNVVTLMVDTSAVTITFSNWPATGKGGSLTMKIFTGGAQTVNWPAVMKWPGGTAPTLTDNQATFTTDSATDDKLDITAHGFDNGDVGQVTTTTTLPAGLAANTLYYVINKTANDFELSLTEGGAAVDITSNGSGTHTFHSGLDEIVVEATNAGLTLDGFAAGLDVK